MREIYTIIHTSVDADKGSFPDPSAEGSYLTLTAAQNAMWKLIEEEKEHMEIPFDQEEYCEEYSDNHWEAFQRGYAAGWFTRYDILVSKLIEEATPC